ncbi:MAG TPA: glycosyltransferase [Bryobacteraceae bacterium]|nr:glycosyltransferase [Bryobacteraceae bacterium]
MSPGDSAGALRVVLLGPYPPPYGGVQVNLVAIREFLQARGISCAVVNLTRHRQQDGDGIYYPESGLGVLRLLKRLRCGIIHLHIGGNVTPRLLALCLCCCWIPGSRSVLTFHSGGYPSSPEGRRARRLSLRGLVFRQFDRVIAVNREIADVMFRYGLTDAKVRIIPPWSPPKSTGRGSLPPELDRFFQDHRPVLLTIGLLEPEYDLPLQIRLLGEVRERHPGAGLVVIGSGSLAGELRHLIATTPYAEHICLCGDVPHPETLAALERCDVFLRTSLYDGDSLAVREALHFGVPVIATDNGMRPQGVALVPAQDERAALRVIETCLEAERPRRRGTTDATEERNLQAVLGLYGEVFPRR